MICSLSSWQKNKRAGLNGLWTHPWSENERWEITEKNWDKETRRFQKTRKTTAKLGGLREERHKKVAY